jgi:O-antigen/teichoic acid export membrane protein
MILFSASLIISIYANFDLIMIGFIKDEYAVGLYDAALKVKNVVLSLSTAITSVFIPRISNYYSKKDFAGIKDLIIKSFKVSMVLALPATVYTFMYSKNVLIFLSGSEYIPATSTLQMLMLCTLALILTNIFANQLLIPFGKEKRFTQSVFVGLFINIILNFLLIPKYGSYGAAIGTLVTEIWNVIWMATGVKEYIGVLFKETKWYKYIIALILPIVTCFFVNSLLLDLKNIYIVLTTGIIFVSLYYLVLLIFKEDILLNNINKVFRKIKK